MATSEKKNTGWKMTVGKKMKPEDIETAIGELRSKTGEREPLDIEIVRIDVEKNETTVFVAGNKVSATALHNHLMQQKVPSAVKGKKPVLSAVKVSAIHSHPN